MAKSASFVCSSIGKKHVMALSGLAWCGFVLMHMLGNLLLLVSADAYNSYSHKLTSTPLIYVAEAGLVVALLLHIVSAGKLTWQNYVARPQGYAVAPKVKGKTNAASKTMALSGTLILFFLILHLLSFKYGTVYMVTVEQTEVRDLYRLAQENFAQSLFFGWYVVCMIVLFFHLKHALFSSLQTLGFIPPAWEGRVRKLSSAFGLFVALGFVTGPFFFFFRF